MVNARYIPTLFQHYWYLAQNFFFNRSLVFEQLPFVYTAHYDKFLSVSSRVIL